VDVFSVDIISVDLFSYNLVISMLRKVLKCEHTHEEYPSVVFVLPCITTRIS